MIVAQKDKELLVNSNSYNWGKDLINEIESNFIGGGKPGEKNGFPCIFAHNAFKNKLVLFLSSFTTFYHCKSNLLKHTW